MRELVAAHLPGARAGQVVALGEGLDHRAFLVDDRLVVRFANEADAARRVEREARLLEELAGVAPLPVPAPAFTVPEEGCLAYPRLPGVPLLDVAATLPADGAGRIAARLGTLLKALHASPADGPARLVDVDTVTPMQWRAEAAAHHAAVAGVVPEAHRDAVAAFLRDTPPAPAARLVFSHNDLGIEHVLVDPGTWEVTGVIDWSDAARVDPAYDFGLLLRDLGPAALERALAAYGAGAARLRERARFHARCALLEDLAFGLQAGRDRYVTKSLAAMAWLFPYEPERSSSS